MSYCGQAFAVTEQQNLLKLYLKHAPYEDGHLRMVGHHEVQISFGLSNCFLIYGKDYFYPNPLICLALVQAAPHA